MIKLNDQEYITTNLRENLQKMIPLSLNRLKNLTSIIYSILKSYNFEVAFLADRGFKNQI